MRSEYNILENTNIRNMLRGMSGYENIRDEDLDNLHYHTKCRIFTAEKEFSANLLFIDGGIVVLERDKQTRSVWVLKYKNILDSKIYDQKTGTYLKIFLRDSSKNVVCVLKNTNVAQKIIMLIRMGKESVGRKPQKQPHGEELRSRAAVVRFGNLRFFVSYAENAGLDVFKKTAISRIGKFFYPEKEISETEIDLCEYAEFAFYVRHGDVNVCLDNDIDYRAAVAFLDGKLDVNITTAQEGNPEIIDIVVNTGQERNR